MIENILIRPYEASDLEDVRWLFARTPPAGRVYVRPQPLATDLEDIRENYLAFWVGMEPTTDGEALVGMLGVAKLGASFGVPEPDFVDQARRIGRVHWVLVAPERQRRGIGRRLIQAAVAWARAGGYEALVLETAAEQEAALAFYDALGFREIGRARHDRSEVIWFQFKL